MTTDLSAWTATPKIILLDGQVGASTDFQVPLYVHYGIGLDTKASASTDGFGHYYLNNQGNTDFSDIRFTSLSSMTIGDVVAQTLLDYYIESKTDGDKAKVWVEVANDCSADNYIGLFFGNTSASSTSSAVDTFVAVIDGVVGAWPLDEADTEVSPTVIADDNQTVFWTMPGDAGAGSYTFTGTNDLNDKVSGTNSYRIDVSAGSKVTCYLIHTYSSSQNWGGTNSRYCHWIKGTNTNRTNHIEIRNTTASNKFTATFTDNWLGWKLLVIPYGSFASSGSPVWTDIKTILIWDIYPDQAQAGFRLDRCFVDIGAPAVDYSGNGNSGVATGTTITTVPKKKKNARSYTNNERISIPDANPLDLTATITVHAKIYLSDKATSQRITCKSRSTDEFGYDLFILSNNLNFRIRIGASWYTATKAISTGIWQDCIGYYDGSNVYAVVNGSAGSAVAATGNITTNSTPLQIGSRLTSDGVTYDSPLLNAKVSGVQVITSVNALQIAALSATANFPDVSVLAGSVCIRKYATSTQPSFEQTIAGGDEQYYYYTDGLNLTPEQETKLTSQQRELRERRRAELRNRQPNNQLDFSKIDWSMAAVYSFNLDRQVTEVLATSHRVGLIKEKKQN